MRNKYSVSIRVLQVFCLNFKCPQFLTTNHPWILPRAPPDPIRAPNLASKSWLCHWQKTTVNQSPQNYITLITLIMQKNR